MWKQEKSRRGETHLEVFLQREGCNLQDFVVLDDHWGGWGTRYLGNTRHDSREFFFFVTAAVGYCPSRVCAGD